MLSREKFTTDDQSTCAEQRGPRRVYCDGRPECEDLTVSSRCGRMSRTETDKDTRTILTEGKGKKVCAITDKPCEEAKEEM